MMITRVLATKTTRTSTRITYVRAREANKLAHDETNCIFGWQSLMAGWMQHIIAQFDLTKIRCSVAINKMGSTFARGLCCS
jgi:hypothetical protein